MRNFVKFLTISVVFVHLQVFGAAAVFAHTLEADGSIGGIFHVDPEDDPIVGQPATFYFELKDKENKFDPKKCICSARILRGETEIFSQPIFAATNAGDLTNPSFEFTFPEKDVYIVELSGQPKIAGDFNPFTLRFALRVAREPSTTAPFSLARHWVHVVAAGIIIVVFLALTFYDKRKEKRTKKESS